MHGILSERSVNRGRVVLLFAAMLVLASCLHRGAATKAAAPATPAAPKPVAKTPTPAPPMPEPLSIPQTHVALPQPQPVDPAALATEITQPTRPPAGPRRAPTPPAVTPAPVAADPPRNPIIQEMISSAEVKRLQDQAHGRRQDVNQIMEQLGKRSLSRTQQNVMKSIVSFLALSDEAEKRNDMRQADALAERAQILARDLQNGK